MHANSRHPLSYQEETKNLPDINNNYNMSQIHDPDNHESINLDYAPLNVNNVVELLAYDPQLVLKRIRQKNVDRLIIGHININSIRNKIEF